MIRALFTFVLAGFVVGGWAMHRANQRVSAATAKERWIKFATYFGIVNGVLLAALAGTVWFGGLLGVLYLMGAFELVRAYATSSSRLSDRFVRALVFAAYLALGWGLFLFTRRFDRETILFVYLIVAVFDAFSQLTGQLIGRHAIAPRVSPKKTLEGLIGGMAMAMLTASWMRSLAGLDWPHAFVAGLALSLASLVGDLAASKVKRLRGLKDFGTVLPGHGGILDRFDSFFAAAPSYLLLSIWFG